MSENLTTIYRLVRLRAEDVRPFAQLSRETKIPIGHLVKLAMENWTPKSANLRDALNRARKESETG